MPADLSTLPRLNEEHRLSAGQINDYRKNGHIQLRGVASAKEATAV
jgi:hypothetical protein